MSRVDSIESEIFNVEGFTVKFRHADGRKVRIDRDGLASYPYQRAAWNDITVAQWREQRFKTNYPDYGARVLYGDGTEAHGVTRLSTVRDSYDKEQVQPGPVPPVEDEEVSDDISFDRAPVEDGATAVWVVRAGYWGDEEPIALENDVATIHWNELRDLSGITSKEQLAEMYRRINTEETTNQAGMAVYQVWAFRSQIRKGDLVILPLVRMWHALAIGEVTGTYAYRTDLGKEVLHTLPVEWFIADLPRSRLDEDLAKALGRPPTVYRIKTPSDAEQRFRAILCDEIDRRQRRILKNYPPITASITHDSGAQTVKLYTLPRFGEFLQLRQEGATEPHLFQVEGIVHNIDGEANSHSIEILVDELADPSPIEQQPHEPPTTEPHPSEPRETALAPGHSSTEQISEPPAKPAGDGDIPEGQRNDAQSSQGVEILVGHCETRRISNNKAQLPEGFEVLEKMGLLGVRHRRKYQNTDGRWVLTTKKGVLIRDFSTEVELDLWWQTFQTYQGRKPLPLSNGNATEREKKRRILGGKERRVAEELNQIMERGVITPPHSSGTGGEDFLKPWSDKYDMPEYDLE